MGYNTQFTGQFNLNKPLSEKDKEFLTKLSETRRVARKVDAKYGIEGEFYVDGTGIFGQDKDETILDNNRYPKTQPGFWCQWVSNEDGTAIIWDCNEKFYNYIEWINYLIKNLIEPRGYSLTGDVEWQGDEPDDFGIISIKDNTVRIGQGVRSYIYS
jgi:hypothetical protein